MRCFSLRQVCLVLTCTASSWSFSDQHLVAVETVTVFAPQHNNSDVQVSEGSYTKPDVAQWLDLVPGANVNRNGPTTGIAQYRGHYGDRVSVKLDGQAVVGAGPNAMDTPLSYAAPVHIEKLTMHRGIEPVSSAVDSLGGVIQVIAKEAQLSESDELAGSGLLSAGLRSNNNAKQVSGLANVGSEKSALIIYGNALSGDNYESANGTEVSPTGYEKWQAGADFRYTHQEHDLGASFQKLNTRNAGTPALPMDIAYIEGKRGKIDAEHQFGAWQLSWLLAGMSAQHEMDNYSQRLTMNPMMTRSTYADSSSENFSIQLGSGAWLFGLDGVRANHNATVTSPDNPMFEVKNFNAVADQRLGAFAQYTHNLSEQTEIELGGRIKQSKASAGKVSHHMYGMNPIITALQDRFNNADRDVSDMGQDVSLNLTHELNQQWSLYAGLAYKERAASYQQRYLWLPMQATGGLADGKTYVGDINLKSEKAKQIDLGFAYVGEALRVSPHVYMHKVEDYIQGVASVDMQVNMAAQMMSGALPLKFANVDATLYGLDLNYSYLISSQWYVDGIAAYVRGERDDVNDNLYRIAPANASINLHYQNQKVDAMLGSRLVAAQNKVSDINGEQATAGYALLNAALSISILNSMEVRLGVDNLLNKQYQDHLGGYNRVHVGDLALAERLPGEGISAWAELDYRF
ncbi:TonB-dependent receptor [Agaribacterium sp. ZY112]|uniref:TonB-dependent receptor n=1 Tax=Agaribacterium sp. ZY112 TaxID=3233574 RepID=UPI003524BA0B